MLCDHLDIDCLCEHQSIVIESGQPTTAEKTQKGWKAARQAATAVVFPEPLETLELVTKTATGGRFAEVKAENNCYSAELLTQLVKRKREEEEGKAIVAMEDADLFGQADSDSTLEDEKVDEIEEEGENEEEEEEEEDDHQATFQASDGATSLLMLKADSGELPLLGNAGQIGSSSGKMVVAGQGGTSSTADTSVASALQLVSTVYEPLTDNCSKSSTPQPQSATTSELSLQSHSSSECINGEAESASGDQQENFTSAECKHCLPLGSIAADLEEHEQQQQECGISSEQEKKEEEEEGEAVVEDVLEGDEPPLPSSHHSCSACAARAARAADGGGSQLKLSDDYLSQDPFISIEAARAHFDEEFEDDQQQDQEGEDILLAAAAERLKQLHSAAEAAWAAADLQPVLEAALEDGAKVAGAVNQAIEAVVDELVDQVADWSLLSLPGLLESIASAPERLAVRWSAALGEAGRWTKREFWRWLRKDEQAYSLLQEVEVKNDQGEVVEVYQRGPLVQWLVSMSLKAVSPPKPPTTLPTTKLIKEDHQQLQNSFYLLPKEEEAEKEETKEESEPDDTYLSWLTLEASEGGMISLDWSSSGALSAEEEGDSLDAPTISPLKWWLKSLLIKALLPPPQEPTTKPPVQPPPLPQQQQSTTEPATKPVAFMAKTKTKRKRKPLKAKVEVEKKVAPVPESERPPDFAGKDSGQLQQQPPRSTPLRWLASVLKKALAPPPPSTHLQAGTPSSTCLSEWPAVTGLSEEAQTD